MGAFLSHTPGGRTVGNSFGDFEAGKLSNPPEFVLSELVSYLGRLQIAYIWLFGVVYGISVVN